METQVSSRCAITLQHYTLIIIKGKHRKQFNNRNTGDFISSVLNLELQSPMVKVLLNCSTDESNDFHMHNKMRSSN